MIELDLKGFFCFYNMGKLFLSYFIDFIVLKCNFPSLISNLYTDIAMQQFSIDI